MRQGSGWAEACRHSPVLYGDRGMGGDAMQRRNFIRATGALALGGSIGAGPVSAQAKPVRVALGWINNAEYAGVWMALENGYFKEEGLEGKSPPGGPTAPPPPGTRAAGGPESGYRTRQHSPP